MCILQGSGRAEVHDLVPVRDVVRQPDHAVRADRGTGTTRTPPPLGRTPPPPGRPRPGCRMGALRRDAWKLAYTLQGRLVSARRTPSRLSDGGQRRDRAAVAPATDGLRNIAGRQPGRQRDDRAVTSTVSGAGDQGADPNKLVSITDRLGATAAARRRVVPHRQGAPASARSCAASPSPPAPRPPPATRSPARGGDIPLRAAFWVA